MLVPMLPDDVAVRPDLGGAFLSEPLFHVGPSQMDDDHIGDSVLAGGVHAGPAGDMKSDPLDQNLPPLPRHIWLALEGPEIIELKQVVLDRDVEGARTFFRRVVAPRVREAARQRGISIEEQDDRLPG